MAKIDYRFYDDTEDFNKEVHVKRARKKGKEEMNKFLQSAKEAQVIIEPKREKF